MSLLRPTNGFDRMGDAKLSQKVAFVISKTTANPNFPSPTPTVAEMQTALDEFDAAVSAALTRDSDAVNVKKQKKAALVDLVILLIYYVLFTSRGVREIAETSGLSFARDGKSSSDITKPQNLRVRNSDQSGQMNTRVNTVKGAIAYIHQYATQADMLADNWTSVTCSQSKCTIEGLVPGTLYYWRVAAVGTKEQIMYSDVVSRVAA